MPQKVKIELHVGPACWPSAPTIIIADCHVPACWPFTPSSIHAGCYVPTCWPSPLSSYMLSVMQCNANLLQCRGLYVDAYSFEQGPLGLPRLAPKGGQGTSRKVLPDGCSCCCCSDRAECMRQLRLAVLAESLCAFLLFRN